MNEIRSFLYAILETEAQNAEEIRVVREAQQKMAADLKQIDKVQREILQELQKNWKVKEPERPVYRVIS